MGKCGKGTGSFGLRNTKTHELCKRCGKRTMHIQKHECSACGYPAAKRRRFNWSEKAKRRRAIGTGRMRYMKTVRRVAKNGWRFGYTPKPKTKRAEVKASA
eukprot:Selendium_serpulae@DN5597_c0_g1_i3.p1